MVSAPEVVLRIGLLGYGEVGRIPADSGVWGQRQEAGLARSKDWRTEAGRLFGCVSGRSPKHETQSQERMR